MSDSGLALLTLARVGFSIGHGSNVLPLDLSRAHPFFPRPDLIAKMFIWYLNGDQIPFAICQAIQALDLVEDCRLRCLLSFADKLFRRGANRWYGLPFGSAP